MEKISHIIIIDILSYLYIEDLIPLREVNSYFNFIISQNSNKLLCELSQPKASDIKTSRFISIQGNILFESIKFNKYFNFNDKNYNEYLKYLTDFDNKIINKTDSDEEEDKNKDQIYTKSSNNNNDSELRHLIKKQIQYYYPILKRNKAFFILNTIAFSRVTTLDIVLVDGENTCFNILTLIKNVAKDNLKTITNLKLPLNAFQTEDILADFVNIKSLTVKHLYFHTLNPLNKVYLLYNLLSNTTVEKLKLNGIKFINSVFLNEIKMENLTYLDIRESSSLNLDSMTHFINNFSHKLVCLKIDGEETSPQAVISLLPKLVNLKEFYSSYSDSIGEYLIIALVSVAHQLNKLSIRKMRYLNTDTLTQFFGSVCFGNLKKLDLFDCIILNDKIIYNISVNCSFLEYLDISWSCDITNFGVEMIINKLVNLRMLIAQGLKKISDKGIENSLTYFDEKLQIYNDLSNEDYNNHDSSVAIMKNKKLIKRKSLSAFENLCLIDFSKCDLINDKILYSLLDRFSYLKVINYYNEELRDNMYI